MSYCTIFKDIELLIKEVTKCELLYFWFMHISLWAWRIICTLQPADVSAFHFLPLFMRYLCNFSSTYRQRLIYASTSGGVKLRTHEFFWKSISFFLQNIFLNHTWHDHRYINRTFPSPSSWFFNMALADVHFQ